ncbi:MAG: hypothetical protein PHR35_12625 [Kiritimatiellae bacterium]|nr:hypothetical protein [Kiritimatiellia bacterium]
MNYAGLRGCLLALALTCGAAAQTIYVVPRAMQSAERQVTGGTTAFTNTSNQDLWVPVSLLLRIAPNSAAEPETNAIEGVYLPPGDATGWRLGLSGWQTAGTNSALALTGYPVMETNGVLRLNIMKRTNDTEAVAATVTNVRVRFLYGVYQRY